MVLYIYAIKNELNICHGSIILVISHFTIKTTLHNNFSNVYVLNKQQGIIPGYGC